MIELYNGDCLEIMDELIAKGVVVDAIITDPPYGITDCAWDSVIPFPAMWERLHKLIKPNGAIVLFGSEPFSSALRMSNIKNYKYDWYWKKNRKTNFPNAKKQPLRNIEVASVFYREQCTYNPVGAIRIDKKCRMRASANETVYKISNDALDAEYTQEFTGYPAQTLMFDGASNTMHPTQKPVKLMEYLIKTYTNEGEIVLDFTMGSGTTGVGCVKLGRSFIGIEMADDHFKNADRRINTGSLATAPRGFFG